MAAVAAAPALLYQTGAAALDGREVLCACKDQPGAECPMHNGTRQQPSGKPSCAVRSSGGDRAAAVLTLLANGGGMLQLTPEANRPATRGVALIARVDPILNTDRPPTSPPPRS